MDDQGRNTADSTTRPVDYVALAPGQSVGRYKIIATLGQGGFGITYLARDTQLDREVALKEYLPPALAVRLDGASVLPRSTEAADDFSWGRERFVAEGRTLASLHEAPAVVKVFDFVEANGTAYMVMELLRGETLERRVGESGPLSARQVDMLLPSLLDGLQVIHDAGFLHRDIKPGNILINDSGLPTLIDFGAARFAIAARTSTMTAIFTPGYAAPEQFTSAKQGPWTDIYGLSATLYHAITGKAPPNAFDRLLEDTYEPLAHLKPPGFRAGTLVGVDAGLEVRFDNRPQSIAHWRSTLGSKLIEGDATVEMPPPPASAERPAPPVASSAFTSFPWPNRRSMAILTALGVLILLVGGYFLVAPTISPSQAVFLPNDGPSLLAAQEAEAALHLSGPDRQRVQMALTALGFDTRGSDGNLGPRSREMIAAWQKARGHAPTGYLTASLLPALLREVPVPPQPRGSARSASPASAAKAASGAFDGAYGGGMSTTGISETPGVVTTEATIARDRLSGSIVHPGCGTSTFVLSVAPSGDIAGGGQIRESQGCSLSAFTATGKVNGGKIVLELRTSAGTIRGTLDKRGS